MKILVTGGQEFQAAAVCSAVMAERDARVVYLAQSNDASAFNDLALSPRFSGYQPDLADAAAMMDILKFEQPDAVIQLAGDDDAGHFQPLLAAVLGYWSDLAKGRKGAFRFVHAWTRNRGYLRDYGASELLLASHAISNGLPGVSVKCDAGFGPYQLPNADLPLWITNAILGRDMTVTNLGLAHTSRLHVDDIARGLVLAALRGMPGRRYELTSPTDASDLEIAHRLCEILDAKCPRGDSVPHISSISMEDGDICASIDVERTGPRLAPLDGWKPEVDFWEGLEKTVEWYVEQSAWWLRLRLAVVAQDPENNAANRNPEHEATQRDAKRRKRHGAKV
ncbi:MAG: NAD-dependent epimerase/dehydratase family protein [Hyphomicrobium sp.]